MAYFVILHGLDHGMDQLWGRPYHSACSERHLHPEFHLSRSPEAVDTGPLADPKNIARIAGRSSVRRSRTARSRRIRSREKVGELPGKRSEVCKVEDIKEPHGRLDR